MITHPNIKTRVDLAKYFGELGFKTGAEIGVCKGKMSRVFCWYIPNLKLYSIDPWTSDPSDPHDYVNDHEANHAHARKILEPFNVDIIRSTSLEALSHFDDSCLDFVYIDGNHSFDYVVQDIIEWTNKVRLGGIISGHDYYRLEDVDVVTAVDAYTTAHRIIGNITEEKPHSWWWEKK